MYFNLRKSESATCNVGENNFLSAPITLPIRSNIKPHRFISCVTHKTKDNRQPFYLFECISYSDSMIAVKQTGSNLLKMQLKISNKSLQSFRSDSSFSFSSAMTDTTSVRERGQMHPSKSPSLRKLSTNSFSVDAQSMQPDAFPSRPTTPALPCPPGFLNKNDIELNTLVQYILLLAVASQLGDLLDEIIEIIELHLHSFPVLVVLGVLPKIFLKKQNARVTKSFCSHQRNASLLSLSSTNILRDIKKYYAMNGGDESSHNLEIKPPPQLRHVSTPTNPCDEWGHFADFDDSMDLGDGSFCLQPDLASRATLSPLHETEIDE